MLPRRSVVLLLLAAVLGPGQLSARADDNTVTGHVTVYRQDGVEKRSAGSGVVVFLERADGTVQGHPRSPKRAISQRGRQFSPRVLVVTKGSEVVFPNDDDVFHNVFSLSRPRPFDLGIYPQGEERSVVFQRAGLVKVYCNIHPDMVTSIVVLNEALFVVTDAQGAYSITRVPDGRYRLRAWNEFGGEYSQEISVSGGRSHGRDLSIREERRAIQHRNKFGRLYPQKYR